MSTKMMAYRMLNWQEPPQLVEVDRPRPGPGEILIKVAGNGLCHSDLGMMQMPSEVISLAEAGLIRHELDVFPLSRVAKAYHQLDHGELRDRAVIIPGS